MKDSDQVLNANQENITFRLQIPLSQKKIKAHSILVLRFKKKEGKQGRKMRYSLTYIQINTQYTLAMYIITYITQNIN